MSWKYRSSVALASLTVLAAAARLHAQEAEASSVQLLPNGTVYPVYRAGTKEPRVSGAFLLDGDRNTYFDAALGGRFGVLRFGTASQSGSRIWQMDVEAAVHPRLNVGHIRQAMESADFRFAFPLSTRRGAWAWKLGYSHLSSHVGDEFLERNPRFERVNYVRDAVMAGITYQPADEWVMYSEVGYAFYVAGGAEPWDVQLGTEYSPTSRGCSRCNGPFVAAHAHIREEVDFSGSYNVTAGWEWRSDRAERYLRLGLEYREGKSSQLEFFDRDERLFGVGIQIGP
jgi:hypothetical protein